MKSYIKNLNLQYENWKDINGYEGLYKISNKGHVKNVITNKILKCSNGDRVLLVTLYKNKIRKVKSVARLVAEHFVPNPNNYKYIYFIDGNNKNVSAYNIQWNNVNKDTKIVVDGIVFNSLTEYKQFCKINSQTQYLLNLEDICDFNVANNKPKVINAKFKI